MIIPVFYFRTLEQAGSHRSRLLMATVYLRDMREYAAFNAVWDAWVPAGTAPVRCCVQATMASPDMRCEIQVTAART